MCEVCDSRQLRAPLLSRRNLLAATAGIAATGFAGGNLISTSAVAQSEPISGGLPPQTEFIIRGANVLTVDPHLGVFPIGDIHVRNGEIIAVAASISAQNLPSIDARNMIAMPGLVETHWHMWGAVARNMAGDEVKTGYFPFSRVLGSLFTPEDNARGVRLALAEALFGGITTLTNWSHNLLSPAYADAEIAVHQEVGARVRFAYGYSRNTKADETLPLEDVARVKRQFFSAPGNLLTLGIASRGPEYNTLDICKREWKMARDNGLSITTHTSISPEAQAKIDSVKLLHENGMLGPDVILVHATNCTRENFDVMARTKTAVSLSPYTELRTGFGMTPLQEMIAAGVPLSLSVDTTLLSGNADMFAIMKIMQNIADGSARSEFGIKPRRILEMATIDGANALGLGDKIGSLTPGKRADIILLRTDALNMAPFTDAVRMVVQSAQPHNVDTVIVDGRILKRDGRLTSVDVRKVIADSQETITRVRAKVGG